jgi:hypothetical protein
MPIPPLAVLLAPARDPCGVVGLERRGTGARKGKPRPLSASRPAKSARLPSIQLGGWQSKQPTNEQQPTPLAQRTGIRTHAWPVQRKGVVTVCPTTVPFAVPFHSPGTPLSASLPHHPRRFAEPDAAPCALPTGAGSPCRHATAVAATPGPVEPGFCRSCLRCVVRGFVSVGRRLPPLD